MYSVLNRILIPLLAEGVEWLLEQPRITGGKNMNSMSNRALRWFMPVLAGLLCVAFFTPTAAFSQDSEQDASAAMGDSAQTTSELNFRTGPNTGSSIIALIPEGTLVALTGQSENGFLAINYNDWAGWVHSDYLETGSAAPAPEAEPEPEPGPEAGSGRVTSELHLRSGPSTADSSLMVMPVNASVLLTGNASNGFYSVSYDGTEGWAYAEYLDLSGEPVSPQEPAPQATSEPAFTTAPVNLRNDPSPSGAVLLVIPSGASVTITGAAESGFLPVTYSGQSGWASADYINAGGDTAPAPAPLPDPVGSGISWPVSGGTWNIIQGYNGGTHQGEYFYALDIASVDGNTAGQGVYAPASGTISWVDRGSGGILIDMGNGYAIAMFHVTYDGSLERGQTVQQGQYLGSISAPGGEGYASTPHVDMTLWQTGGGGRSAAPYTGDNAISGMSFSDIGGGNQHGGTQFNP